AESLCASDARRRWSRYAWRKAESRIARDYSLHILLSGGLWRTFTSRGNADWPACWPEMESIKFASRDWRNLFKFEGLGRHGQSSRQRGSVLFEAGFTPKLAYAGQGMNCYDFVPGTPLRASDLSTEVLDRMAVYCAFRNSEFRAPRQTGSLEKMVRFN